MIAALLQQHVVLVESSRFDCGFDRCRPALSEPDSFVGVAWRNLGERPGKFGGRLRGEVVCDVNHALHLVPHRLQDLGVPEAEVDAFVRAAQVEESAPICRVNPAALGVVDRDGIIVSLSTPALHHVFRLETAEILGD